MAATEILTKAVEAYGGEQRWRSIDTIETSGSCVGLLATWKRGHGFVDIDIRAKVWEPWIRLSPLDDPTTAGILDGNTVRIERDGEVVESRDSPRDRFPYRGRLLRWDQLDMVYFAGYAFWNYITMPALFLRDEIEWTQKDDTKVDARFPTSIPTHSAKQRFHFDPVTGLVSQYDYTAKIFGSWAKASHVIDHASSDGVVYTKKRLIWPTIAGKPGKFPLLFTVTLDNYRPVAS